MTTINETITEALGRAGLGGYARQAQPVVTALIEREQRIYTGVVEAAVSAGLGRANVQSLLSGLGMAAPSAQPVGAMYAQPQDTEDTDEEPDDSLRDRIDRLEAFARANGYTG